MWQRFTEAARRVIYNSQEEAQKLGDHHVSTEHMLLGLCLDDSTVAAHILAKCGTSLSRIREEIGKQASPKKSTPQDKFTLTPRAKRCIDLAYDEARGLKNDYIGTEHLLLGLIREGDGLAGRALAKLGVELHEAREAARALQGRTDLGPAPTPSPSHNTLKVRYDFQLLHPVDQVLLALITDKQSDLGRELLEIQPTLDVVLPSIVSVMSDEATADRTSLEQVLDLAQKTAHQADRAQVLTDDLFLACLLSTTDRVRLTLNQFGIDPFPNEDADG